jgi:hypothetical protein
MCVKICGSTTAIYYVLNLVCVHTLECSKILNLDLRTKFSVYTLECSKILNLDLRTKFSVYTLECSKILNLDLRTKFSVYTLKISRFTVELSGRELAHSARAARVRGIS